MDSLEIRYTPEKGIVFQKFQDNQELEISSDSKMMGYMHQGSSFDLQKQDKETFINALAFDFDGAEYVQIKSFMNEEDFLWLWDAMKKYDVHRQFMLIKAEASEASERDNSKQIEDLMREIESLKAAMQSKPEQESPVQKSSVPEFRLPTIQKISSELKRKLNFPNTEGLEIIYKQEIYKRIKHLHHHIEDNPYGIYQDIVQESIDTLFDMKKYQKSREEYLIQQADSFIRTLEKETGKSVRQTGSSFIKESSVKAPDISQKVEKILERNYSKPGKIDDNGDLARDFKNFVKNYLENLEKSCEEECIQTHNEMLYQIQQLFKSEM